jgi:GMP synthase (glutamine-hydrolysing)
MLRQKRIMKGGWGLGIWDLVVFLGSIGIWDLGFKNQTKIKAIASLNKKIILLSIDSKPMKILVVDNGGQWTHREWRVLKYIGVESAIVPNTLSYDELDADGLVLSGGAPRVGEETPKLGNSAEYLDKSTVPILGICAGHQFMTLHFGGSIGPSDVAEFGKVELIVVDHDEILKGLPDKFQGWLSHNDEIKSIPTDFIELAYSENCKYQAMRHKTRPIFGLQFHPEVEHTEHGEDIFKNFVEICKR